MAFTAYKSLRITLDTEVTGWLSKLLVSGVWKDISDMEILVNGSWKTVIKFYVLIDGVWKEGD